MRPIRRRPGIDRSNTALDRVPATALVLIAIMGAQLGAAVAVGLIRSVGPVGAVEGRLAFAGLLLCALAPSGALAALRQRTAPVFAMAVLLVGMSTAFYQAIDRIPLGIASAIAFLGPLGVAAVGSRSWRDAAHVLLAAAGVYLVADATWDVGNVAGLAWALANAVLFAVYLIFGERFGRAIPSVGGVGAAFAVAGIATLPFAIASAHGTLAQPGALARSFGVGALLGAAIAMQINALSRIKAPAYGVLVCLEPAVAAGVGWLLVSQALSLAQCAGIGAVVAACVGVAARRQVSPYAETR